MHKKSARINRLTNKRSGGAEQPRSARMTILQRQRLGSDSLLEENDEEDELVFRSRANSRSKSRSSSSWDQQQPQQRGGGSWSEDIEEAVSLRVLAHWAIVERTLHDEEEQLQPGLLLDECIQWRNQIPHLRIVGKGYTQRLENGHSRSNGSVASAVGSASRRREKSAQGKEKGDELLGFERDLFSREASALSSALPSNRQAKEQVLDHIVEYICKELAEIEAEKEAEHQLSDNFDEFLKIAPAPTTSVKNPLNGNSFHYKAESSPDKKNKEKEPPEPSIARNKLGTVFNERIIVSPVPFVLSTRESFSTIRRTPIHFLAADNLHAPNINRSAAGSRRENTRRKLSLTRKTPLIAAPHVQSSWNTPVYPTVWPKNVKLAPIDTSRLPSSKRRPSKTADSLPLRRSRNSLSPISRSVQPASPRICDTPHEGLEIRGSHIDVHEAKAPRTAKLQPRPKRIEGQ